MRDTEWVLRISIIPEMEEMAESDTDQLAESCRYNAAGRPRVADDRATSPPRITGASCGFIRRAKLSLCSSSPMTASCTVHSWCRVKASGRSRPGPAAGCRCGSGTRTARAAIRRRQRRSRRGPTASDRHPRGPRPTTRRARPPSLLAAPSPAWTRSGRPRSPTCGRRGRERRRGAATAGECPPSVWRSRRKRPGSTRPSGSARSWTSARRVASSVPGEVTVRIARSTVTPGRGKSSRLGCRCMATQ